MKAIPFTIIPNDLVEKLLLPIPSILFSVGPEVLDAKKGMLLPEGITEIPLNCKLLLPPSHLGLLIPPKQQAKKKVKKVYSSRERVFPAKDDSAMKPVKSK